MEIIYLLISNMNCYLSDLQLLISCHRKMVRNFGSRFTCGCHLDSNKAFNSVPYQRLLTKFKALWYVFQVYICLDRILS